MKATVLAFLTFIFLVPGGYSQTSERPKGPKAKNYKVWKADRPGQPTVIYVRPLADRPTGPAAKNRKPWQHKRNPGNFVRINTSRKLSSKGPKAKNYQPWRWKAKRFYTNGLE